MTFGDGVYRLQTALAKILLILLRQLIIVFWKKCKLSVDCAESLLMILNRFYFVPCHVLPFLGEGILDHLHLCKCWIHPILPPPHLVLFCCFGMLPPISKHASWDEVDLHVLSIVSLLEVRTYTSTNRSLRYCHLWMLKIMKMECSGRYSYTAVELYRVKYFAHFLGLL